MQLKLLLQVDILILTIPMRLEYIYAIAFLENKKNFSEITQLVNGVHRDNIHLIQIMTVVNA